MQVVFEVVPQQPVMLMAIIQGAQYYVPIKLKQGETVISPSNCDDVKVMFGGEIAQYTKGTLTWDSVNSYWKYWLDQEQSLSMKHGGSALKIQAEVKIGNDILPTELVSDFVGKNIIKEEF